VNAYPNDSNRTVDSNKDGVSDKEDAFSIIIHVRLGIWTAMVLETMLDKLPGNANGTKDSNGNGIG